MRERNFIQRRHSAFFCYCHHCCHMAFGVSNFPKCNLHVYKDLYIVEIFIIICSWAKKTCTKGCCWSVKRESERGRELKWNQQPQQRRIITSSLPDALSTTCHFPFSFFSAHCCVRWNEVFRTDCIPLLLNVFSFN